MRVAINIGPIMVRSDADLPYLNQVRIAHQAKNIVYRAGPAHKIQTIVPIVPLPSPESCVIRTIRPTTRRSNACLDLHAVYGCVESRDTEEGSEATEAEDAETSHVENHTSNHVKHCEERFFQNPVQICSGEDRPGDRDLCITDLEERKGENIQCENDDSKDTGSKVGKFHKANCATDIKISDDDDPSSEDSDAKGLELEACTRWSNYSEDFRPPQESQLTTLQFRIKENMLKEVVQQALKARRNGKIDSSIFSKEEPEEEDRILEMILELMDLGESRIDVGEVQEEESRDIEMMVRNNFHTLMRNASRPYRPSGISGKEAERTQCLEAFRQKRWELLKENPDMSMEEILKDRSLDFRPR